MAVWWTMFWIFPVFWAEVVQELLLPAALLLLSSKNAAPLSQRLVALLQVFMLFITIWKHFSSSHDLLIPPAAPLPPVIHTSPPSFSFPAPLYRLLAWRVEAGFRSVQLTHSGSVLPVLLPARLPALCSAGGPAVFNESHEGGRDRRGGGWGGNGNLASKCMLNARSAQVCLSAKKIQLYKKGCMWESVSSYSNI